MASSGTNSAALSDRLQRALEGRYTVETELGRGGVGAVYRAHDAKHGRKVAVKVLLPQVADAVHVSRFLREITIAARLNHPHILPLHDSGEAEGLVFYVMPYVKDRSLRERLDREARLPLEEVTRIAGEVASALDRAHGEGILHRDIKPGNILLVGNYAVVADFGIATALQDTEHGMTRAGAVLGTGTYMSPEQAADSTDIDGRSDLYSLACTVYELLAGSPPFRASHLGAVLAKHLTEPPPHIREVRPDVPEHVERALIRALQKEPDDRFPTLMDFASALARPVPSEAQGAATRGEGLWQRLWSGFGRTPVAEPQAPPSPTEHAGGPDGEAVLSCGGCGASNTGGSIFCRRCGERLGTEEGDAEPERVGRSAVPGVAMPAESEGAERRPSVSGAPERELRQLTVVSIDAVLEGVDDSDPEAELEAVQAFQSLAARAVDRYDGHVVEKGASGLLAYFGHPVAHEDDPVRAALSGLRILEDVRQLSARLQAEAGLRLVVRAGVHTGPVVIGSLDPNATADALAVGRTPLLASKLRDQAPPDGLLVSSATHRLFRGYFSCQELGDLTVQGSDTPVATYRVLAESGTGRLLSSLDPADLPPLVGRDRELQEIMDRWERASEGSAQLVFVSGEAGIGKSRLVAAALERLADRPHLVLQAGCSPYHTNTALHGVISLLERWFGIRPEDTPQRRFEKLVAAAQPYLEEDAEAVPLLASLLQTPVGDGYEPLSLEPGLQRRRTLELLLQLLRNASTQLPLLVVLEDLHWVDPSTLEFLAMWLDRGRSTRTMVLGGARPGFHPSWDAPHVTRIPLTGLSSEMVDRIVARVTGDRPLPKELLDRIVRLADGVPLFVEEVTRSLLESGGVVETEDGFELADVLSETTIPLTLRDALTARIDRLEDGRALVQLGAVIGREFSSRLLLDVSDVEDRFTLDAALSRAVDAGILEPSGSGIHARFRFRHALIQENAYQSLVRNTRKTYHRRIMQALQESFPEEAEANPEHMAYHCTEAGETEEAIRYWRLAGVQAMARAAFSEATHHLRRGLQLLESLPEGSERDATELSLQTALGVALQASQGYAAPEVQEVYDRARILCRRGGGADKLLPVLWGTYLFYGTRARYGTALEVAEEMLSVAQADGRSDHILIARLALGLSTLYVGRLTTSRDHFLQAIQLYGPVDRPFSGYNSLGDPGSFCLSYLARTLWILGDIRGAFEASHEALTLARRLDVPLSRTQALGMHTLLLLVHGDDAQAMQYAAETIDHASRHGFAYWLVLASMCQGWLMAQAGETEAGITRFRTYLDLYQKQGAELGLSWFYGTLARMVGGRCADPEAFALLELAQRHVDATDERYYEPEIHRIFGQLELVRGEAGAAKAAEERFSRAIDTARRLGALSWELRAALSLARLLREQGRLDEAVAALEVVGRMPDQPEPSVDLRAARELLATLPG